MSRTLRKKRKVLFRSLESHSEAYVKWALEVKTKMLKMILVQRCVEGAHWAKQYEQWRSACDRLRESCSDIYRYIDPTGKNFGLTRENNPRFNRAIMNLDDVAKMAAFPQNTNYKSEVDVSKIDTRIPYFLLTDTGHFIAMSMRIRQKSYNKGLSMRSEEHTSELQSR